MYETCSKLTTESPERLHSYCSGVFIVNSKHISLIEPAPVAERVLSFYLEVFLGFAHYFFLKLRMILDVHMVLYVTEPEFLQKNCSKNGKNGPK